MKVLIVEDHPAVAKALRFLFETNEIACATTADPNRAIALVEKGDVDLVLQDMNFTPGATSGDEGMELFRRLRTIDAELPVLLITAWTSLETAVKLVKEGASDYLAKPWDDAKLLATVRNLLHTRELSIENKRLRSEKSRSKSSLEREHDLCGIIYESEAMHRVISLAIQVAKSDVPVLITGPNGSGKEKVAEIIHANSRRSSLPFIKVNAGALPEQLVESELFGAEPGAYTGSQKLRIGRFETAHRGTLFLDEIANLPLAGQAKLLRVLQSGEFERLGSSETRRVDVRVLCATNANLHEAIAAGKFRQDLFFRLNVIEVAVPSLKKRREDIIPLAMACAGNKDLSADAREALLEYEWPGNVRELQNRMTRALVMSTGDALTAGDLGFGKNEGERDVPLERKEIEFALLNAGGSVSRAAASLGVSRQALYRKMDKLGIVLERRPRGAD